MDLISYTHCATDGRQAPLTFLLYWRTRALELDSTRCRIICGSQIRFVGLVKSRQRRASRLEQAVITDGRYGTVIEQWLRPFARVSYAAGSVPSSYNVSSGRIYEKR